MALEQTLCTSFKLQLLSAVHDFSTDVFKIALYTSAATNNADTTAYSATNEVAASGTYVAGGQILTGVVVTSSGTTAYVDWTTDPQWTGATITARSALIYNSSKSDYAVAVLDFGSDKTVTSGPFTVTLPAPGATTALIRLK